MAIAYAADRFDVRVAEDVNDAGRSCSAIEWMSSLNGIHSNRNPHIVEGS
jgi:hypothetical protein